ncbi:MAG: MFS transporter, partial [Saccharothrix sp.]|nr:MFS transporter [Saccharothrix sp.]
VVALVGALLVLVAGVGISAPALVEAVGVRGGASRGAAVALYACAMFIGASLGPQLVNALHGWEFGAMVRVVAVVFAVGAVLGLAARQR